MEDSFKNSYKVLKREMLALSVYNMGFQRCEPGHKWGPGVRDHFLIHYIVSGKGFYETGNKKYLLKARDAFLVYPYSEVYYYADKEDPWEYYWVGFAGRDAKVMMEKTDFTKEDPVILNCPFGEEIRSHLLRIYEARGNEFLHAVEMAGELHLTISCFIRGTGQGGKGQGVKKDGSYVQKAMEYIEANYSYPITVEDVAGYVGISRSHLFREFKEEADTSPKEYLSEYRLKQACYLLASSDLSMTAIANSTGFDNSLYFSKVFKKKMNVTPSAYAKLYRKGGRPLRNIRCSKI